MGSGRENSSRNGRERREKMSQRKATRRGEKSGKQSQEKSAKQSQNRAKKQARQSQNRAKKWVVPGRGQKRQSSHTKGLQNRARSGKSAQGEEEIRLRRSYRWETEQGSGGTIERSSAKGSPQGRARSGTFSIGLWCGLQ